MFGKRKFLLAFLNNAELKLVEYRSTSNGMEKIDGGSLEFPADAVKDSSILNTEIFSAEISKFLETKPQWKGSDLLLVIPEEKIFIKGIELDLGDLERRAELRSNFVTEVPFLEQDLIVRERLIGRVLEFSAVHKKFLADLQGPFIAAHMSVAGLISVPQAIALNLNPEVKSFLLAFYDNDFALALAENASVIFSETWRLSTHKIKEAIQAFDHFVRHLKAAEIKSISIILGEDELEDALRAELESRDYSVKEIRKIGILDMIADYYDKNRDLQKDWNILYVEEAGFLAWVKKQKKVFLAVAGILVIGTAIFGAAWMALQKFAPADQLAKDAVPAETAATSTEPVSAAPVEPAQKSDFPIQILNGTKLSGEAGRLKAVLLDRGFSVSSAGNNTDQNQAVTTIFMSSETPDEIISDLRVILETRYQEVLLNSSAEMAKDIRIVIGKKK